MNALLALASGIDRWTSGFALLARWAVLLACLSSAANALLRHALDYSSNAFLEIQWYFFAACVMLGAADVLRRNEHVRVDLIYGRLSSRARLWVDLLGLLLFLLPSVAYLGWLSAEFFWLKLSSGLQAGDSPASLGSSAYLSKLLSSGEVSANAGGLIRWPVALCLPLGFALLGLQGLAELIRRWAALRRPTETSSEYQRPLQ